MSGEWKTNFIYLFIYLFILNIYREIDYSSPNLQALSANIAVHKYLNIFLTLYLFYMIILLYLLHLQNYNYTFLINILILVQI